MTNDKEDRSARPMISGAPEGYVLTVSDMRDALSNFPDNAEIAFGTCSHDTPLQFYRFKKRGDDVLGIEFS
jgi:hypothetical protein